MNTFEIISVVTLSILAMFVFAFGISILVVCEGEHVGAGFTVILVSILLFVLMAMTIRTPSNENEVETLTMERMAIEKMAETAIESRDTEQAQLAIEKMVNFNEKVAKFDDRSVNPLTIEDLGLWP